MKLIYLESADQEIDLIHAIDNKFMNEPWRGLKYNRSRNEDGTISLHFSSDSEFYDAEMNYTLSQSENGITIMCYRGLHKVRRTFNDIRSVVAWLEKDVGDYMY